MNESYGKKIVWKIWYPPPSPVKKQALADHDLSLTIVISQLDCQQDIWSMAVASLTEPVDKHLHVVKVIDYFKSWGILEQSSVDSLSYKYKYSNNKYA